MSFPRYPKYKPSGVEWLGEVPEHWEVKRLRYFASVLRGKFTHRPRNDPMFYDGEFPFVQTGDITGSSRYITGFKQTLNERGVAVSKEFPKGTLVMAIAANIGDVAILDFPAFFPDSIVGLVPMSGIDLNYLYYLMIGMKQQMLMTATVSTQMNLNVDQICSLASACPTLPEQTRIVAFLDAETAKIDELVAEQRRLMDLLKEKRQAVISHAVTKGLNPNAPMKSSGIEWLGEVPEHWEVRRVKSVSSFITSGPRGWSERVGEVGSLFVQSGDLNDSLAVEFAGSKRVQVGNDAEATRTLLCNGDVVVCITGAKTGNVAICTTVPEAAYINQHLCLIRPTQEILPVFLGILLKGKLGQTYFELSQYGLKQGLSLEDVKEAPVLVPPRVEQVAIVAYLGAESDRFDTLTAEAQRAIDLLQERRTALISAAVTGQIDLRRLPARPKRPPMIGKIAISR
ncbi:MAG: restriction endonuclease subunit S [Verrucomicrobiota bacterium]